ncbi:sensor histidine kinase [Thiorhodovibrio frisius]|uniref:histidine kinase n=1 Tax=Thiorhodovibrio frisius TaxID=631362 RepID=H8Z5P1_9GAMM|nr:sensor histidine kinase [Thiorhodovibrio frisius]EIC19525.1 signal transduction histidine kinase [Thiorhodovibrio frisius]WPL20512.1 Sensor protein PhoQ [Thiorhodovibrio frisius]
MKSLESRLHIGLGISLFVLIGAVWWSGHEAMHRTADAFVLSRLEHDAEGLVGALTRRADGHLEVGNQRLTPVYHQPFSGHYFVIETVDGQRIRSRSLWDQDLADRPLSPGTSAHWRAIGPDQQRLLVWEGGYHLDGIEFALAIAEDVTALDRALAFIEQLFAGLAIGGLVIMLLVQRFVVRRAFAALAPVYQDIERLESGQTLALTERVPSEILPLVRKLNRLLLHFAQRLERSRTVAGNLAHSIKGPLSLLRQQLKDPDLNIAQAPRQTLIDQVERLRQLAERQLKRARLAGAGGAGVRFNPNAELPTLARLLGRIHAPKILDIQLDLRTSGLLSVDREDMLELLGNLLDNACKWAIAHVRCSVTVLGDEIVIRVEDDGPGCSEHDIAAITERGVRLDEQISGHGLGLAIAREIVESYQGRIRFHPASTLAGLCAEIRLPVGDGQWPSPC